MVINSGIKEALEVKTLADKLKDSVDDLSDTLSSTTKNIIKLKTAVAESKKALVKAERNVRALNKLSSGDVGVQGGCDPDWRDVSEEVDGVDTMDV